MLFWADLSQGLVYCDLHTGDSAVEFSFISLPRWYLLDKEVAREPLEMKRAISCIGGSIQFVCIERHSEVSVWTLDLDRLRWKEHNGFPCFWKDICWQVGFTDSEVENVVPQYPVLMPGGALCLWLSNMPRETGYICSFDMRNKKVLWSGTVPGYGTTDSVILPPNFFREYYRPSKEVLPTHKRKLLSKARISTERSFRK